MSTRNEGAREDALAAAAVALLLVPQGLAYALLAGLPPQMGLYASVLPLLAYALLGSSSVLAVGPVALTALMISQAVADAAALGLNAVQAALALAAWVALLLAAAAALRMHALAALLSAPVLRGFEFGAALSIAFSQLPALLGASVSGVNLLALLQSWAGAARPWHAASAVLGLVMLLWLWLGRGRIAKGVGPRLGASRARLLERLWPVLGLGLAALLLWAGVAEPGIARVGALPPLQAALSWPLLPAPQMLALLPSAALIALVTYVSSLAVAESLARRRGQRIAAQRELWALAAANAAAAGSGGMPVAGSFSRSVVAAEAGARSRCSGAWVALWVLLAALVLPGALAWLPRPALAALIIVAVLSVLDFSPFAQAWRYARAEWALMAAVALLAAAFSLEAALLLGVAASIALLLQGTASPHIALIGRVPGTEHFRNAERHAVQATPGVLSLRIDESLLFTNSRSLVDGVMALLQAQPAPAAGAPPLRRLVLQMSPVNRIDYSGLEALRELHAQLRAQGLRLDVSEIKGPVLDRLRAARWEQWFDGRLYLSHHQAMQGE
jgi:sulfate permease, SulP family